MQAVPTHAALAGVLADAKAAGKTLDGLKVRLYTNAITITPDTAIGDLTTATFTGYADSSLVVWSAALRNTLDRAILLGGQKVFSASDGATPNTVRGWALFLPGAPDVLMQAANFDEPIPVTQAGDYVPVDVYFSLPPDTGA